MKRMICLLLVLTFAVSFSGCKNATDSTETSSASTAQATEAVSKNKDSTEPSEGVDAVTEEDSDKYFNSVYKIEDSFTEVYKEDKNYVIKESEENAGNFYEIYDDDGNLLDKGYHGWRGSFDISKNQDIVTLEYGFGGTNVFPMFRFYDTARGRVSRYFDGPVDTYGDKVAFFREENGEVALVVQDMFDSNGYYRECTGQFDHYIQMYIKEFAFSDDGKEITIEYHETDNTDNVITETFILNN